MKDISCPGAWRVVSVMAELVSPLGVLPHIPDNVTLAQFMLDVHHPCRPTRKHGVPWFIEDHTGRTLGFEEASSPPHSPACDKVTWAVRLTSL